MDHQLQPQVAEPGYVILFYRYHALSESREIMEPYRAALEQLCESLELTGRILVGLSRDGEGVNGTLAGTKANLQRFTTALLGRTTHNQNDGILDEFWSASEAFAKHAQVPVLKMDSTNDFKWSVASAETSSLFPDLNIKLVKEIISTGGQLSKISLDETRRGYLTPQEWHEEMQKRMKGSTAKDDDTVLIDCRNHKEFEIGHFPDSVDPNTKTFAQFPTWVTQNKAMLKDKTVLMYCTGGIRCEKASAFIRNETGATQVRHLQGGIHKYLEQFPDPESTTWRGKNFVFDARGATGADATQINNTKVACLKGENDINQENKTVEDAMTDKMVVGRCLYCQTPHDTFMPSHVCTVCREPVMACPPCSSAVPEYHCHDHFHLRHCYYTNLACFSEAQLERQSQELQALLETMAVGRRFKQKRKTLNKQLDKIQIRLDEMQSGNVDISSRPVQGLVDCRNCGTNECKGDCWGFHGLKRMKVLQEREGETASVVTATSRPEPPTTLPRAKRQSANQRIGKVKEKERVIEELKSLKMCLPPSVYRDSATGIRIPPPVVRSIVSTAKGKWCGNSIESVLANEFADLSSSEILANVIHHGLLSVNGVTVSNDIRNDNSTQSVIRGSEIIRNMDVLRRILHWHEPPVLVPEHISVQKVLLSDDIQNECLGGVIDDAVIYVCDKPSTVPVHQAGPYLANTLTHMLEGQENLDPRSLIPCHRIDRVTSGLTLCCTNPAISRLIQGRMVNERKVVKKMYLARVLGRFPDSIEACQNIRPKQSEYNSSSLANYAWCDNYIEVDAGVDVVDGKNGVRSVSDAGKPSQSRFQHLNYDAASDTSLILCCPITGRGHQLRVHLQWLRYPIHNDVLYSGVPVPNEEMRHTERKVIELMEEATRKVEDVRHDGPKDDKLSISAKDFESAKQVCRCCSNGRSGIRESFSDAQLLLSGHIIDLHAFRYSIEFDRKAKPKMQGDDRTLATMTFEVGTPSWAALLVDNSCIKWLQ